MPTLYSSVQPMINGASSKEATAVEHSLIVDLSGDSDLRIKARRCCCETAEVPTPLTWSSSALFLLRGRRVAEHNHSFEGTTVAKHHAAAGHERKANMATRDNQPKVQIVRLYLQEFWESVYRKYGSLLIVSLCDLKLFFLQTC